MWSDRVIVAMPTVRRRVRSGDTRCSVRQWRAVGLDVVCRVQPEDLPLGHASQRINAETVIRDALRWSPAATHLIFAEDDVDIDVRGIQRRLPVLLSIPDPVTFWATGRTFYPADIQRQINEREWPLVEQVRPVIGKRRWYGTLAVLLPVTHVQSVLSHPSQRVGWDSVLQDYLCDTGTVLWQTIPHLAEHRGIASTTNPRGGRGRSLTFGMPSCAP